MSTQGHEDGGAHGLRDGARREGRRRLKFVLAITATFTVVEFVGGWLSNSLALLADAAHMLTDVAALAVSLFALWFAQRPATPKKSFGYLRLEILAALVNGAVLIVLALFILREAWKRFHTPAEIEGRLMLVVATSGLLVNIIAALLLHRSAEHSLNIRGAYLHVLGDLLGSVAAITAALIILGTGWSYADPLISIVVALLVLFNSWRLVRESVNVLLEAVPPHIDLREVHETIVEIEGVEGVHDLHVWTLTSGYVAMSGHATVYDMNRSQEILEEIHSRLYDRFEINHITVQLEPRGLYRRPGDHP